MAKEPRTAKQPNTVASRLPSTRERRPALAALAVLLIVGGALASGWLALRSGHREYYLQVNQEVPQGQRFSKDDLKRVSLPEGFEHGVSVDSEDTVVKQYATTRLLPNTILTPDMIQKDSGIAENKAQIAVQTSAANAADMRSGAPVALYIGDTEGSGSASNGNTGIAGEVASVQKPSGSSIGSDDQTTVRVTVDSSCGASVANAASDNTVSVALVGPKAALREQC